MKNKVPFKGEICLSLQGRDKGNFYFILQAESDGYVLVADGDRKTLSCPKRKNLKHLELLNKCEKDYGLDFSSGKVFDSHLAFALKRFKQERQ
jgi:ribosomal protein L14E/L6E/L27E